jgi:hypothetical protein
MTNTAQFSTISDCYNLQFTVNAGETVSNSVDLGGTEMVGLFIPAEFDGTTLFFEVSTSLTGTYVPLRNGDGSRFDIVTAASNYEPIRSLAVIAGVRFVRLVCVTAQSTTSTVFTIASRPLS